MSHIANGDNPRENGVRFTLQRTKKGAHGVNESLTRAEVLELAEGVKDKNPTLARRLVALAGE